MIAHSRCLVNIAGRVGKAIGREIDSEKGEAIPNRLAPTNALASVSPCHLPHYFVL